MYKLGLRSEPAKPDSSLGLAAAPCAAQQRRTYFYKLGRK
jgi:hypothetical protein